MFLRPCPDMVISTVKCTRFRFYPDVFKRVTVNLWRSSLSLWMIIEILAGKRYITTIK